MFACVRRSWAKVADVNALAGLVNTGGAGDQKNRDTPEVDAQPAREGTGSGIIVGLIENLGTGDCALLHLYSAGDLADQFDCVHQLPYPHLSGRRRRNSSRRWQPCWWCLLTKSILRTGMRRGYRILPGPDLPDPIIKSVAGQRQENCPR